MYPIDPVSEMNFCQVLTTVSRLDEPLHALGFCRAWSVQLRFQHRVLESRKRSLLNDTALRTLLLAKSGNSRFRDKYVGPCFALVNIRDISHSECSDLGPRGTFVVRAFHYHDKPVIVAGFEEELESQSIHATVVFRIFVPVRVNVVPRGVLRSSGQIYIKNAINISWFS